MLDKGDQRDPVPGGQELHIVVHAQAAAVQPQGRRIGGQHQDVQARHGRLGERRIEDGSIPDLHGLFTSMNRIYRIFSGLFPDVRRPVFQGIRKPVPDHRQSQLPLQLLPVLLILCILCIHVF